MAAHHERHGIAIGTPAAEFMEVFRSTTRSGAATVGAAVSRAAAFGRLPSKRGAWNRSILPFVRRAVRASD